MCLLDARRKHQYRYILQRLPRSRRTRVCACFVNSRMSPLVHESSSVVDTMMVHWTTFEKNTTGCHPLASIRFGQTVIAVVYRRHCFHVRVSGWRDAVRTAARHAVVHHTTHRAPGNGAPSFPERTKRTGKPSDMDGEQHASGVFVENTFQVLAAQVTAFFFRMSGSLFMCTNLQVLRQLCILRPRDNSNRLLLKRELLLCSDSPGSWPRLRPTFA